MKRTMPSGRENTKMLGKIAAIPYGVLPMGDAKIALCQLTEAACDVHVYEKCYGGVSAWFVWLPPAVASQTGDHTMAEWLRDYATLTAEALARQAAKGAVA